MAQGFEAVLFDLFGTLVTKALLNHAQLPVPAVVVTSEDVTQGKPAPDCYLLAAS